MSEKDKICPECGTTDCMSEEEYQKHIKITGAGVLSVDSSLFFKTCKGRQQLKAMKKFSKTLNY